MRILHIGKFFPPDPGGMEVFLADLVAAQRAAGDDACALVHGTPRADDPPWLLRVPVAFSLLFTPVAPGFRKALKAAIRRFNPDVLHLHMPNPSVFWALTLAEAKALPWVVHWHSDVLSVQRLSALMLAYQAYRPFEQAVLEHAERVIVTSPDYLAASRALSPWGDKCTVVPLGMNLARIGGDPDDCNAAQGWPAGAFRLLSLGRLSHYKGFETLIDAVVGLPEVHLVIAGDGELRARLVERIRHLGAHNITLAGKVDDATKAALLRQCDAFALASCERSEAFGIAVMEAMAHARPCIVSALPGSGLPWLVRSSAAGITVEAFADPVAWRAAIAALRADPAQAKAWGESGREAIRTRFTDTHAAAAVRAAYPVPEARPSRGDARPLIVIPARNESATIASVIAALRAQQMTDILVIDDQSSDDTAALARAAGAIVLSPVLPMGAWGAMQTGIRYAVRHGYEQVVTIDADGQHEPAYIPALLEAARNSDVVIGAYPERGSPARQLAWRYFRAITGFRIEDLTSGFRCYNRAACEVLADEEATLLDYQDLGVLLLLRRAGLKMVEIPVEMYPRTGGPSRIFSSWGRVLAYMVESTLLCVARWHPRHHFDR